MGLQPVLKQKSRRSASFGILKYLHKNPIEKPLRAATKASFNRTFIVRPLGTKKAWLLAARAFVC